MSNILEELQKASASPAKSVSNSVNSAQAILTDKTTRLWGELVKDCSSFMVACVAMTIIRSVVLAEFRDAYWLYQHALPWALVAVAIYFDRINSYAPMRAIAYAFAAYVLSPRVAQWLVTAVTQGQLW